MATPKLYEAACKGTHLPNDDGSEPSSAPPFGQPVTFTATVSNSEPVTHAGWGPWEDNPSLSEDLGIAWVSGDGGTRDHGNNDVALIHNLTGVNGLYGDHDDGWCMGTEIDFPESVHALYDLVV